MFKKFALSAAVIVVFILYALHVHSPGEEGASRQIVANSPLPVPTPETTNTPPISAGTNPPTQKPSGQYKDGTYTGSVTDAFYGNVQVQAVISGGRLTDVKWLQYPNDRQTSIYINSQAMPLLTQEAIQAQSAQVDGVSGASATSAAFIQSLGSALQQAI